MILEKLVSAISDVCGHRALARAPVILLAGYVLTCAPIHAVAAPAPSAETFVSDVAAQVLKTMAQARTEQEREASFLVVLRDDFDMARITRFVLGRYWLSANDQERKDFRIIFEAYLARAYSNRFGEYTGETVKVTGSHTEGSDATIVSSEIVHQQRVPAVKLDWRIYVTGKDYRVVDVSVAGVSMVLTHKQEFAAIIERDGGGVAGLGRAIQLKMNSQGAQR